MRAGLIHDTYVEIFNITKEKKSRKGGDIPEQLRREIEEQRNQHGSASMYEKLAKSIAPEIFGHLDVKKSLLLMMTGGVDKDLK